MPPAAVVEIRYEEGERSALRPVGRGEALERVAAHACNLITWHRSGPSGWLARCEGRSATDSSSATSATR
jgi:hypothetical protein